MNRICCNYTVFLLAILATLAAGCKKGSDEYRNDKPSGHAAENTYDFLKAQHGLYDNILALMDKAGLSDTLRSDNITIFMPQDISLRTAMANLNFTRAKFGDPGNWTLDSIPQPIWDTLLRRYMIRGIINSDSLRYADGVELHSLFNRGMNGKRVTTNASGIIDGGPMVLQYSDMNNSRFIKDWASSNTQNIDIKTKNGMVHILESKHVFGFTSFVGMAYPKSLIPVRSPFLGYPLPIPGIVNAALYDDGGEGIAYHTNDKKNPGGQYRNDGIGIENCGEGDNLGDEGGKFSIGWTNGGQWLKYTVQVNQTGDYKLEIRVASPGGGGPFHLEFDDVRVMDDMRSPATGGWQNWTGISATVKLTAGQHTMKFVIDGGGFNYHRYIFTKL